MNYFDKISGEFRKRFVVRYNNGRSCVGFEYQPGKYGHWEPEDILGFIKDEIDKIKLSERKRYERIIGKTI